MKFNVKTMSMVTSYQTIKVKELWDGVVNKKTNTDI